MTPQVSVMSGSLGDIFWDLPPWMTYTPGFDMGCSIYVANPTAAEKEYALMARLSRESTVISEEALPVFGYAWFKVAPADFVRLRGARSDGAKHAPMLGRISGGVRAEVLGVVQCLADANGRVRRDLSVVQPTPPAPRAPRWEATKVHSSSLKADLSVRKREVDVSRLMIIPQDPRIHQPRSVDADLRGMTAHRRVSLGGLGAGHQPAHRLTSRCRRHGVVPELYPTPAAPQPC